MAEDSDLVDLDAPPATGQSAIVSLANHLLRRALEALASEIRIEPEKDALHVRARADGVLREVASAPREFGRPLAERLKLAASLDLAERGRPQDGEFRVRFDGRLVNVGVRTEPMAGGDERVVLRFG